MRLHDLQAGRFDGNSEPLLKASAAVRLATETLEAFEARAAAIDADRRLSAVGKRQALREAADAAIEELGKLEAAPGPLFALRGFVKQSTLGRTANALLDATLRERLREIRHLLAIADERAAGEAIDAAFEQGDADTLLAVADAPAISGFPPELRDRARRRWLEVTSPEEARELAPAIEAERLAASHLAGVVDQIEGAASGRPVTSVEKMARGFEAEGSAAPTPPSRSKPEGDDEELDVAIARMAESFAAESE